MPSDLKFYNLLAHISCRNQIIEENLAVRQVWRRGKNTMFNLYFYRTKKNVVVDGALIRDILDLNTEKFYEDIESFLQDYFLSGKENSEKNNNFAKKNKLLAKISTDITILVFFARHNSGFSNVKLQTIRRYINACEPRTTGLSPQYLDSMLKAQRPRREDFYKALDNLEKKTPEEATKLVNESIKICLSDGQIHYDEKLYLAEMIEVLREKGLETEIMI